MQPKKLLTNLITRALEGTFEPAICKRYIRQFNIQAEIEAEDVYPLALKFLNEGDTEMAVGYIITALDIDKDHKATFNLAKTMLFSLSEDFDKANGFMYKQKNPDLNKYMDILNKSITKLNTDLTTSKNELTKLEGETGLFQKMKNKQKIAELQAQIVEMSDKFDKTRREQKKVTNLVKIEEYVKVLSLILEVITLPSRYSWLYK